MNQTLEEQIWIIVILVYLKLHLFQFSYFFLLNNKTSIAKIFLLLKVKKEQIKTNILFYKLNWDIKDNYNILETKSIIYLFFPLFELW